MGGTINWSLCCGPREITGSQGHQVGGQEVVGLRYMKGPPPLSFSMASCGRVGGIKEDS